jgi:hypothetical protein
VPTDVGGAGTAAQREGIRNFVCEIRGLTVREIQAFLLEMYAVEMSPDLISRVTDAVVAEVTARQTRSLEALYPVVFFDALRVKARDGGTVPRIGKAWRRAWASVMPFFAFPPEVRRVIYHQRARKRPRTPPQSDRDARSLPERRCGHETDLARAAQHHRRVAPPRTSLARRDNARR